MKQLSNIQSIRFSDVQLKSLQKLKEYDVNVSQFIRLAVAEKIKRDWKVIKDRKERVVLPF
jgi:post-segregation antitoxin (ccd killing protein)